MYFSINLDIKMVNCKIVSKCSLILFLINHHNFTTLVTTDKFVRFKDYTVYIIIL